MGRRSWNRGNTCDSKIGENLDETGKHRVSRFPERDDLYVGDSRQVAGPIIDANTLADAADATLHGEWDVNGSERLVKNAASDLLGIGHHGLRRLERFGIEHIRRTLSAKKSGDVVRGHSRHFRTSFDAGRAHVRSHDDVGALEARMDEGFLFENVEGGAGNFSGFEGVDESRFIDDRTACGVNDERGWFHAKEFWRVKEPAGLRIERNVQGHEVGFGK